MLPSSDCFVYVVFKFLNTLLPSFSKGNEIAFVIFIKCFLIANYFARKVKGNFERLNGSSTKLYIFTSSFLSLFPVFYWLLKHGLYAFHLSKCIIIVKCKSFCRRSSYIYNMATL